MEPWLKRNLGWSLLLAALTSIAVYGLAFEFFTVHEEAGIPAQAAWPIACWTFPIVFLGSAVVFAARKAGERKP